MINKAFPHCVQCDQVNDGGFDSCKTCVIQECRIAIKNLNYILDNFAKVVKAAKVWSVKKEEAAKNPEMLLLYGEKSAAECTEAYDRAAKIMDELFESETVLVSSLGDLAKAGIKVKI